LGLAILVYARTTRSNAAWAIFALSGSLWASPGNSELLPGTRLLEAAQSRYQALRVVERGEGAQRQRWLQVNEGLDSFQSVWQAKPGLLGPGYYYDGFALPAAWSKRASGRWNTLVLGLGAGSVWRVLEGTLPPTLELAGDGVEIDEAVVELGKRWMDLCPSPLLRVHSGVDARVALQALAGPYDQIIVDAYANQLEIPAHLASAEFFALAWSRLTAGGWLCLNVGAFGQRDPLLQAIGETLAQSTGSPVLALAIPFSRNVLLLARRAATWPTPASEEFRAIQPQQLSEWADSMTLEGCWWVYQPSGGPCLSDDHAPLEALQRASLNFAQGAQ
jgi:spermidine synthase